MPNENKEPTKHDKHNRRRSKEAQKNGGVIGGVKRRINISISGDVWDALDKAKIENKSAEVEKLLIQELEKLGVKF